MNRRKQSKRTTPARLCERAGCAEPVSSNMATRRHCAKHAPSVQVGVRLPPEAVHYTAMIAKNRDIPHAVALREIILEWCSNHEQSGGD